MDAEHKAFRERFIAILQGRTGLGRTQCVEAFGHDPLPAGQTPEQAVEAYIAEASREMDQEFEP